MQALAQLIDSGNRINAEIAARMMVADYPSSATARDCLARVVDAMVLDVNYPDRSATTILAGGSGE